MQEQAVTYTYILVQGAHCETKAKTTTKPKKSEQHHDDEWVEMQSSNAGMQMMAVGGTRGMCAGYACACAKTNGTKTNGK